MIRKIAFICMFVGSGFIQSCTEPASDSTSKGASQNTEQVLPEAISEPNLELLQIHLESLQEKAQRIKDSNDIKRLQRIYGYYVDEALWDQVIDLFSDDATLELALDGVYKGKTRIREYLNRLNGGEQGLIEGQLNEHLQLMPVITLADDGMSAKGRWRAIILAGQYGKEAVWGEGPYENEYVKENDVWKISKLHWFQTIRVPYEGGWAENADVNDGKYVSDDFPPDEPTSIEYETWPSTFLPPFHFENPVSRYVPEDLKSVQNLQNLQNVQEGE